MGIKSQPLIQRGFWIREFRQHQDATHRKSCIRALQKPELKSPKMLGSDILHFLYNQYIKMSNFWSGSAATYLGSLLYMMKVILLKACLQKSCPCFYCKYTMKNGQDFCTLCTYFLACKLELSLGRIVIISSLWLYMKKYK